MTSGVSFFFLQLELFIVMIDLRIIHNFSVQIIYNRFERIKTQH